jgi:uncharacterized membrane protein YeiB
VNTAVSPATSFPIRSAGGRRSAPSHRAAGLHTPGTRHDRIRITGLDLARGLAVLGMFGAHVGVTEDLSWTPSSWAAVAHGRPAALFAVLAGVSIGLLSGGMRPATGDDLVRARVRITVRAAWVFVIGGVLELFGTDVAVILSYYAVLFVLALPFLRWSPGRLLLVAAGLAVAAPPTALFLARRAVAADVETPATTLLFSGEYPALWWWTFLLIGLALARLDLTAARVPVILLLAGTTTAVAGYLLGWVSTQVLTGGVPSPGLEAGYESPGPWDPAWLSGAAPHSGTPFWLFASAGVAVATIAVCLVVADALPRLAHPVACVGAMALTVYSLQIVALWAFQPDTPPGTAWGLFAAAAVAGSVAWRRVAGHGPLERLLTWSTDRAAGRVDRRDRPAGQAT